MYLLRTVTYLDDMVKAIRAMASRPFLVDASCLTPKLKQYED
jgi:hypothetical protein